ncbi:CCC motif membrane protein [Nonlabens sp.]|uniref:CCC motif membrane protein n=1 Tax=Nonlabens sp. TaxID=1888209 RepID=UPI003265B6D2
MQKLNTTLVYILSIAGFICCCWLGGLSVIPAAIAFFIANKELTKYEANPAEYANGPAMKTAKTVALVILILSALNFIYTIYGLATTPWEEVIAGYEEGFKSSGVEF